MEENQTLTLYKLNLFCTYDGDNTLRSDVFFSKEEALEAFKDLVLSDIDYTEEMEEAIKNDLPFDNSDECEDGDFVLCYEPGKSCEYYLKGEFVYNNMEANLVEEKRIISKKELEAALEPVTPKVTPKKIKL